MTKYSQIRNNLKTGDLVLFSGGGLISTIIKWFTKSKWSHVGMVVRSRDTASVLIWESTTLSKIKIIHGKQKQGVAVRFLNEAIDNYKGIIAIRGLREPLHDLREATLFEFREEVKDRPYEKSKWQLFKSVANSELIAEAYQRIGLMPNFLPANEFTPKDLATFRPYEFLPILTIEKG